jgi:hypothetical protein
MSPARALKGLLGNNRRCAPKIKVREDGELVQIFGLTCGDDLTPLIFHQLTEWKPGSYSDLYGS